MSELAQRGYVAQAEGDGRGRSQTTGPLVVQPLLVPRDTPSWKGPGQCVVLSASHFQGMLRSRQPPHRGHTLQGPTTPRTNAPYASPRGE